jgi:hypothetical protein
MAQTTRQTSLLVQQDWTKIYQSFTNADFTSYDFETLRNSMINYIKVYYPETFNDFLESSEYLALIDMIAFLGQSLAFRTDLNARENFIDTAQRRDSILKLARMLSYNPSRTVAASGLLKIDAVKTTENIIDSASINLANATIHWNDLANDNWLEQFTAVVNASLISSQSIGKPGNSQKINNIQTDEYSIALNPTALPTAPFTVAVNGTQTAFEAVSATSVGESYIYESDPTKAGLFNVLYRNDNNGNGSNNTGFFVMFKQGSLNATKFTITNAIPNNYVPVNTNNITNTDQWLYSLNVNGGPQTKWTQVPALPGINVVFNNLTEKNLYQINTTNNDQVNLVFGDGSFANIPQGQFIFYYRTGNGTTYTINPDDLSSVSIGFTYISKNNALETMTVTASLKYTVTNANAAPSLTSIKNAAPQQYYTQNRMVTGEDYNTFPITSFPSIQKIKAVNRTSSGVSLYLDAIDPTGSYSSTNIFADDGILSANNTTRSTTFSFLTSNDIYNAIYNKVIPAINSTEMHNYYYGTYPHYNTSTTLNGNVVFNQTANSTSTSSGTLANVITGNTLQIGPDITGNLKFVAPGASLQFTAPSGYYFDAQHVIKSGTPTAGTDTLSFYATVTGIVSNTDFDTPSQVTFGTVVPDGAVLSDVNLTGRNCIVPAYKNDLPLSLIPTITSQIQANQNFGLYFDQVNQVWKNILPADIGTSTNWLLKFTYSAGLYTVAYKIIEYTFASEASTNFYFDPSVSVYNSATGLTITDSIKILKINSKPGSNDALDTDVTWKIYDSKVEPDGFVDQNVVLVTFPDTQMPGVPDNLDLYTAVADGGATRSGLYFQYKHNAPARSRIDPTPVNMVDLYILVSSYTSSYITWLRDLTGTISEPYPPTPSGLENDYATLSNFKTVSDTLIFNTAQFKPLFGAKANPSLQARFQVIKNPNVGLTDNEIKIQVVNTINDYFDIGNWDFGDTFYFSELAAYLHSTLAPNISSVVIVPASSTGNNNVFGKYFQINAEPWEIITSAATVNDIDIVSAVTAAQLGMSGINFGPTQ